VAKGRKNILVRVPPEIEAYLDNNRSAIARGVAYLAKRYYPDRDVTDILPITDQGSIIQILRRVIEIMGTQDGDTLQEIQTLTPRAYPLFRSKIDGGVSLREWPQVKVYRDPLDALVSSPLFSQTVSKDPLFESKTVRYSFALFLIGYYLLLYGGGELPTQQLPPQVAKGYWTLLDYELEYSDHLVVSVGNITPKGDPESLASLSDPYGTYHDIVFASALLAGIHSGVLALPDNLAMHIQQLLPVAPPPDNASFEDAFYTYQRNIVLSYGSLSRRVRTLSEAFGHLVTVVFKVDPSIDKDQFGPKYTFADVRLRPGTYWVHANFITILPEDRLDDVGGTTQRNDIAIFTDRSFIPAPALRVSKYRLFKLLADPKANRKEYMILVRSKTVARKQKNSGEQEQTESKIPVPQPVRIEYELLSLIPISPEVVIRRDASTKLANIMDVRDTFGLDSPSSYKDVLDSLYLLARAYAPSYAVLYDGGVVGKDQYLALLAAALSYLSPTLALTNFDRKYDSRIHTLLYGIKGVGKTYLFEQYHYHWPHNTLFLFAGVRISEAKLLGGAMSVDTGKSKSSKLVFRPGEIIKADGGMIMIDELDRLARDSSKRAIADAIANVMASGYAPARHVLSDTPTIDVRVHGSVIAAANPIGLKSGNYVEEMFAAMFILNDEIRAHYKRLAPEVVDEIESKFFERSATTVMSPHGRKLIADLEYLASDTPYTFIHYDFYSDPTLHKYIDRVSFAIPMYTMVGEPPQEFLKSGKASNGDILIYDRKVADGVLRISQKALLDFTQHVQTVSPFAQDLDDTRIYDLLKESTSISAAWRKASAKTYANKIKSSIDSRETMRVFLRSLGSREAKVAYRLAHTVLKIFDEDRLKRPYVRAILELIGIRDSLLYSNPSGHVKTPIPLPEALRTAIRDVLYAGEVASPSGKTYLITPSNLEAVYVDVLSNYVIRIPEKSDAPFDAVEHFQTLMHRIVSLLTDAGVLVNRQDDEGEVFPAYVSGSPDDLVRKLSFKVNKQGYLHVFYDGNDLGSVGKVI